MKTVILQGERITATNKTGGNFNPTHYNDITTKLYVDTQVATRESTTNKVTALSSASTDTQYPSAKCVYDANATKQDTISDLETIRTNASAVSGKENIGKMTIGGTEYSVITSTTDSGTSGYITFVLEA